jgi:hypothetical protein
MIQQEKKSKQQGSRKEQYPPTQYIVFCSRMIVLDKTLVNPEEPAPVLCDPYNEKQKAYRTFSRAVAEGGKLISNVLTDSLNGYAFELPKDQDKFTQKMDEYYRKFCTYGWVEFNIRRDDRESTIHYLINLHKLELNHNIYDLYDAIMGLNENEEN